MSDFTFEILDSVKPPKIVEEQDPILCPKCNGDSLCRVECFARCHKCGVVIVAEHIEMPESFSISWNNLKKLKECYGKYDDTTK
ncbi:MAG: hypothetical protein ACTSSE_19495 [Candidatus Thorarchaeota archaeon]